MRRAIKKYLCILTAISVMLGGIPLQVSAKSASALPSDILLLTEENGVIVSESSEFIAALAQHKSPITVSRSITIDNGADKDNRMLPVMFPENTVVRGSEGVEIYSRSPIQLEGDGVCFQNIDLKFNSSTSLGSVPHREIFLAGHSLTLDHVSTYLEGSGTSDPFLGTEKELLPTVYAGGYTGTDVGSQASLTVTNSGSETMFQAIYLGHGAGDDNNVPYVGNCVLNLDANTVVRENIDASLNSQAQINMTGGANQYAKATQFYGNDNTTLRLSTISLENAVLENIGQLELRDGSFLSAQSERLNHVTLQSGSCLDLCAAGDAIVCGDFTGSESGEPGILVLDPQGSLAIQGTVSGTTRFQTSNRLFPGVLVDGKSYITADEAQCTESNFMLADKSIAAGYSLNYSAGVWTAEGEPVQSTEISRIDILSCPSKVDLRKLGQREDPDIPDKSIYLEIAWYDENGNKHSQETIEDYLFYEIDYIIPIKSEYWESDDASLSDKTDWHLPVSLVASEEHPDRYYLQTYNPTQPGDYTLLFCSTYSEEELITVADVKALKDTVLAERRIHFYDEDPQEPDKPVNPDKPTSPTDPEDPDKPDKPTSPTDPEDPDKPDKPTSPTDPEDPDKPDKPTSPTDPEDPDKPDKPTSPTDPEDPDKPDNPGGQDHTHKYQATVTKNPTCTEPGIQTFVCECNHTYTKKIPALGHRYADKKIPATPEKNGWTQKICRVCSNTINISVITRPQKVTLGTTAYTYNGKTKTPSVTVTDRAGKILTAGVDYQISYPSKRKNVGLYTVTIVLKGNYVGTMKKTFKINPRGTSLKKLTAKSRKIQVTWKKQSSQTDGYQIQYCTDKKFKGKTLKTITVPKKSAVKKNISGLKANKKYYVRIRTFKKNLFSNWSKPKTVRTKK